MSLEFTPIDLEQQKDYHARLAQCSQTASEYSFINLWGWAREYGLQWAWHENLVWVRQAKPYPALWAPVGDWAAADWDKSLAAIKDVADRIIRVPEKLMHLLQSRGTPPLEVMETRGQWDYLYSREDLVALQGNRYHKKKNLVNQFRKNYMAQYLPFGPGMVDQALAMQEDWCTWRDCESHETLASENKAIELILGNWRRLEGITGGAIRVDSTLVAYTIAEIMPDQSLVIHFEKGNPDYKGSYQAINQMFLEQAPPSVILVNREQDLDNEGLRKAKLSYHPVDFVKKWEVRFR
ncbi:MAG: phosphatidylglycerol lysyltransferase domain-containing protein [Desulfosarcinaceae bacterium]